MTSRHTLVDGGKVFICSGSRRREVAPGWERGWLDENVYGWQWIGPFRWGGFRDLIVLDHVPTIAERQAIEARFRDAPVPNGENRFDAEKTT